MNALRYTLIVLGLGISTLTMGQNPPRVTYDKGRNLTATDLAEIQRVALAEHPGVIELMHAGINSVPGGPDTVGVYFVPFTNNTFVIHANVEVVHPDWPVAGSSQFAPRALEPRWQVLPHGKDVIVQRVFEIAGTRLEFCVPDQLSYKEVEAFLQAIHKDEVDWDAEHSPNHLERFAWLPWRRKVLIPAPYLMRPDVNPIVAGINSLRVNDNGAVALSCNDGRFYELRKQSNGRWRLVSWGNWNV